MYDVTDYLDIAFSTQTKLYEDEKWVTRIECKITAIDFEENVINIGKANFTSVTTDCNDHCIPGADELFGQDGSLCGFYHALYEPKIEFLKGEIVDKVCQGESTNNILIVNMILINKAFRGKGVAAKVIDEGMRVFGGNSNLCALKASPLQFGNCEDISSDEFKLSEDDATNKLFDFYKSIGFVKLEGKGGYMVRANPYFIS